MDPCRIFERDYESIVSSIDDQKDSKKRAGSSVALVRLAIMITLSPVAIPVAVAVLGTNSVFSQARAKKLLKEIKYKLDASDTSTTTLSSASPSFDHPSRLSGASWRAMNLLLPEQREIQNNMNQLEWEKVMVYIDAMNAHGSIICRERLFTNDGGRAVVQHLVDSLDF